MKCTTIKTRNYFKDRRDPKTGLSYKPKALVLHITDGTLESTLNHFKNPRSNASSNYIVDPQGNWISMVDEKNAAWANGKVVDPIWKGYTEGINPNLQTISVEVVSFGGFPNLKQWISWARGCKEICQRHGWTVNDLQVVNHFEINSQKTCPGKWFSRQYLKILWNIV